MNNKLIAGVLGGVVVLGGAYFFMNNRESSTEKSQNSIAVGEPNPSVPQENTSNKKMSFNDFLKQGGSYVCSVNQYVENIESKGTVYIDGENIRGTFSTSVSGMNINSELLVTGGFTYTWSSMMSGVGFKAPVDMGEGGDSNFGTSGQYSFNAEQIGDYNCEPWNTDKSKFSLPRGITFTEIRQ